MVESVTAGQTSQWSDVLAIVIDNYSQPGFGEGFRGGYTRGSTLGKEASPMTHRYLLLAEYIQARGPFVGACAQFVPNSGAFLITPAHDAVGVGLSFGGKQLRPSISTIPQ